MRAALRRRRMLEGARSTQNNNKQKKKKKKNRTEQPGTCARLGGVERGVGEGFFLEEKKKEQ